jgi:replicative DNA helicase
MLSDLRESGSIEQDADMVLFLYRPEYYGITEDEQGRSQAGVGEVIIAKHRNGETGIVPLRFIGKYVKFADLEESFAAPARSLWTVQAPACSHLRILTVHAGNVIIKPSRMDDMHDEDAPF